MINNNNFELPKFIIPIVALKKKIYEGDDDIFVEKDDTLVSTTEEELVEKYTLMNDDDAGYLKDLNILFKWTQVDGFNCSCLLAPKLN